MCGRVVIKENKEMVRELHLKYAGEIDKPLDINGAPGVQLPLYTDQDPYDLQYFTWSLIPWHSKTGKPDWKRSTFNARTESLGTSPLWKPLVGKKHCVIITGGFYEWQWLDEKGKKKQPWLIKAKESNFTFMAGLWENYKNKETEEMVSSCTIITNPANEMMAEIHNTNARMPAFLTKENAKHWIDRELPINERLKLIEPVQNDFLIAEKVQKVGDIDEYARLFTVC